MASGEQDFSVFLSYRREDTPLHALLLRESLEARLGCRVFMDVASLTPGDDFVNVIEDILTRCRVLLAIIGPGWISASNHHGRRLDDPGDFVRVEIETALDRGIAVIPVLVDGAVMPTGGDLPEGLSRLVRKEALSLSVARWKSDIATLTDVLTDVVQP